MNDFTVPASIISTIVTKDSAEKLLNMATTKISYFDEKVTKIIMNRNPRISPFVRSEKIKVIGKDALPWRIVKFLMEEILRQVYGVPEQNNLPETPEKSLERE